MPILAGIKNLFGMVSEEEKQRQQAEVDSRKAEAAKLDELNKQTKTADEGQLAESWREKRTPAERLQRGPLRPPAAAWEPEPIQTEGRDPSHMQYQPAGSGLQRPPDIQMPGMIFGGTASRPRLAPRLPQNPIPVAAPEPAQLSRQPEEAQPNSQAQPDYAREVLARTAELNRQVEASPKVDPQADQSVKRETVAEKIKRTLRNDAEYEAMTKQLEESRVRREMERLYGERKLRITDED